MPSPTTAATGSPGRSPATSRNRTLNWIAKSTAIPTNRIANATEIRFSGLLVTVANPVVSNSPATSVTRIGTISRHVRTANASHTITSAVLPSSPATAPCATVANSSSVNATDPVIRTRACPVRTNSCRPIAARIASVAAAPGANAPKSSFGCASTNRNGPPSSDAGPDSSFCQLNGRGVPVIADRSAASNPSSAGPNAVRSACPRSTPMPTSDNAANNPRALGSAANCPRNGCASIVWSSSFCSTSGSRNSSPALSKNGDASGRRDDRNSGSFSIAASSPAAVASAASGLSPSMTATSRSSNCGNSFLSSDSRCFHGRLEANSVSTSVVTASRVAASHTHPRTSPNATSSTIQGRLAANSTVRTIGVMRVPIADRRRHGNPAPPIDTQPVPCHTVRNQEQGIVMRLATLAFAALAFLPAGRASAQDRLPTIPPPNTPTPRNRPPPTSSPPARSRSSAPSSP